MLSTIDLDKTLTKEEYVRDLIRYQFDLSWCGQVMVERLEGFCTDDE